MPSNRIVLFIPILAASAYVWVEATTVVFSSALEGAYAAFLLALAGIFLIHGFRSSCAWAYCAVTWSAFVGLHLFLSRSQINLDFFGDVAVITAMFLAVPYLSYVKNPRVSRSYLWFYLAACATAALAAPGFRGMGGRFEGPNALLIGCSAALVVDRRPWAKLLGAFLLVASGLLSLAGGTRAAFLMVVVALVLVALAYRRRSNSTFLIVSLMATLMAGVVATSAAAEVSQFLNGTRISTVSMLWSGRLDGASQARVDEARDAIDNVIQGGIGRVLIGMGPGSGYRPFYSNITENVRPDGLVHTIHIGPVLVFFRFGILGMGVYMLILRRILSSLRFVIGQTTQSCFVDLAVVFGSVLVSVDFLFKNVTINPMVALLIGAVLVRFPKRRLEAAATASSRPLVLSKPVATRAGGCPVRG